MSKKKVHHEEHLDETWLIPYADMLTLLLALFIVMFAMSQVDNQKLAKMADQFNVIFSGGDSVLETQNGSIVPNENLDASKKKGTVEEEKMKKLKEKLENEIEKKGYANKVKVELNKEGLEVSIQEVVLFRSGEAVVLPQVSPLLIKIADLLKTLDNNIKVLGHTDNVPIHNQQFRSNWDLSAMRAINVMKFLTEKGGINPGKFSIQAYGEYKPIDSNATITGRTKNRRVEILIIRKYPVESKGKIAE